MEQFDVVVIGGGHAGCEAAAASARRGATVALVTFDRAMIGAMSCNPAIGGIGKGHLIREVDVFGGLIAQAADRAAVHYRMLNRSRGRAVWGPRVQADRRLFAAAVADLLSKYPSITIVEDEVIRLRFRRDAVEGVDLSRGGSIASKSTVIASGTFLGGKLHTGRNAIAGGRAGEPASIVLAEQLREISTVIRLKTGTPPRLDGRTIDWAALQLQESDRDEWTMAPYRSAPRNPQLICGITRTNETTHAVIAESAGESPLMSGDIDGVGPRYCPSIEDKVRRFGDRDGHQIFLEPEGLDTNLIYPNGISTSLSVEAQARFVRSIVGLAQARIVRPGYAVEYDAIDPRGLGTDLQSRSMRGLFLAGQVNGTTGYEEAAAQGLVAGLNAAAHALALEPVSFDRQESYIGVMIDDLTLQGISEPYRMLTARAENRLHLRSDNAETRLFTKAAAAGCLPETDVAAGTRRMMARQQLAAGFAVVDADYALREEVNETIRYAPYVERERARTARLENGLDVAIPEDVVFARLPGLSQEMADRLTAARPSSIAQAQRIRGITPAAVATLLAACRRVAA